VVDGKVCIFKKYLWGRYGSALKPPPVAARSRYALVVKKDNIVQHKIQKP